MPPHYTPRAKPPFKPTLTWTGEKFCKCLMKNLNKKGGCQETKKHDNPVLHVCVALRSVGFFGCMAWCRQLGGFPLPSCKLTAFGDPNLFSFRRSVFATRNPVCRLPVRISLSHLSPANSQNEEAPLFEEYSCGSSGHPVACRPEARCHDAGHVPHGL